MLEANAREKTGKKRHPLLKRQGIFTLLHNVGFCEYFFAF